MPGQIAADITTLSQLWGRTVEHTAAVLLLRGLRDAQLFGVCRDCGCTDFDACGEGCGWAADDLCTRCNELGETDGIRPDPAV